VSLGSSSLYPIDICSPFCFGRDLCFVSHPQALVISMGNDQECCNGAVWEFSRGAVVSSTHSQAQAIKTAAAMSINATSANMLYPAGQQD
jgi:hypothetical protein